MLALLGVSTTLPGQNAPVDIARNPIQELGSGATAMDLSIFGVKLGMQWSQARSILDNAGVPYIIQKGTAPSVFIPPQNPTYYFVLNPSSYSIVEMGVMGATDLPNENQYLFDAARWRLTTARTQFLGTEGEYIVNEEGTSYNFPFQGVVLKYLSTGAFRFVLVHPTNQPLTRHGASLKNEPATPPAPLVVELPPSQPIENVDEPADALRNWQDRFQRARTNFESRQYANALEEFRTIAASAPDEMLRARASYWIGECHFGLKQYSQAHAAFTAVLHETNIESLRAPAQFMLSKCDKLMNSHPPAQAVHKSKPKKK
jgi:hypothetical protein